MGTRLKARKTSEKMIVVTEPGFYCDKQKLDIIRLLYERNIWEQIDRILSLIDPKDLSCFSMVNRNWRNIIQLRRTHNDRRLAFVVAKKMDLENIGYIKNRAGSSSRNALRDANRDLSPLHKRLRSHLPTPGSSEWLKPRLREGDKVLSKFEHCPDCSSKSSLIKNSLTGEERGHCQSPKCESVFCTACNNPEHTGSACRTVSIIDDYEECAKPDFRGSKRRLRRIGRLR